ncbi:MAG: ABC transporter ATP-binding protein [Myxococcaceae bacterium]|nr:ABC transporter ATP-binding protein [Myxococcaceae bacterium]
MNDISIAVEKLRVEFGDFCAVDNISFKVRRGEIFGFLGANGAGKTTTIRVLCGLLTPTSGTVRIGNTLLEEGEAKIKSKVGYMSQKLMLYNDLTVEENLNFTASLRKLDRTHSLNYRQELLDFIQFNRPLSTRVGHLSGGLKQQVSLAIALLHNPEIVFLDEPTVGVSPVSRKRFWDLIRQLSERGVSLFVTTHYMDEAEQCDRIALMRNGKIIALDSPENLKNNYFHDNLYEFEPKSTLRYKDMTNLNNKSLFSFFAPYGLRFHAVLKNKDDFEKTERTKLEEIFHIRPIRASLEDVFIQAVESRV